MIVVMKSDATAEQIDHAVAHITALGLEPQVIKGAHQTVIAAIGEERPGLTEALEEARFRSHGGSPQVLAILGTGSTRVIRRFEGGREVPVTP